MYVLENALISIMRNKGRNLLIGIIICVISCATAVTLAINNSSNDLIFSYASKYETEATLTMNRKNMMRQFDRNNLSTTKEKLKDSFNSANSISVSDILKYGDSKYVKSYYYTLTAGVNLNDVEPASMTVSNGNNPLEMNEFMGRVQEGISKFVGNNNQSSTDFSLKGYSSIESMNEFIEGKYVITDGKVSGDFESKDCLINSELAILNDIKVGDKIEVKYKDDKTYELVVSGIFEEKEDTGMENMSMFTNSANTIITNTNVVSELEELDENIKTVASPTFILTDKDVVEDFEKELVSKGLDENLTLQTNKEQVEGATKTISNVKTFAITFLIITLIIGTIVLLVINMINIRERKYEIGVLRTIGMKKSMVTLQFISELMIVSVVFLLIGASIGALVSVPISNSLLENEISSSQNDNEKIANNFGGKFNMGQIPGRGGFQGVPTVQAYDSIDAVVDIKVLAELLGIGVLITLISSTSAMISIQKFSPLTILKERS